MRPNPLMPTLTAIDSFLPSRTREDSLTCSQAGDRPSQSGAYQWNQRCRFRYNYSGYAAPASAPRSCAAHHHPARRAPPAAGRVDGPSTGPGGSVRTREPRIKVEDRLGQSLRIDARRAPIDEIRRATASPSYPSATGATMVLPVLGEH